MTHYEKYYIEGDTTIHMNCYMKFVDLGMPINKHLMQSSGWITTEEREMGTGFFGSNYL